MNLYGAGLSTEPDLREAVAESVEQAAASLEGRTPDLAVVFASHRYGDGRETVGAEVLAASGAGRVIGCIGESIVGSGREVEDQPSVSVFLASLPEAELIGFSLQAEIDLEAQTATITGLPDMLLEAGEEAWKDGALLFLGDPTTFPVDQLLEHLGEHCPGLRVFGGMASGALRTGDVRLFLQEETAHHGAVALWLGGVPVRHVTSQGCRPIGPPMVVTACELNVVQALAGKSAMEKLREIYQECEGEDRALLENASRSGGLHIGIVVDEHISQPDRGDFLVRAVLGSDPKTGSLVVGDLVRRGRTVRFHVRDPDAADEDLRELLARAWSVRPARGALLFTCNGRGTRFFPTPNHDAGLVEEQGGAIPVAGFFAAGELGPVGPRNFLHGYTASLALFD